VRFGKTQSCGIPDHAAPTDHDGWSFTLPSGAQQGVKMENWIVYGTDYWLQSTDWLKGVLSPVNIEVRR